MANFETVGLIGPRSEQREPKEKKKDMWDKLKDGLDIANGVLGIGVSYNTIQKYRGDIAAQEDARNGVLNKGQELDYVAKGLDKAQPDANGAYPPNAVTYKSRQGDDTPTAAFVRSQKPQKPLEGWVTSRDKSGKTTRTYGPLTSGMTSTLEPLPQQPKEGWVTNRDPSGKETSTFGPIGAGTTSSKEPLPKADKPPGAELPIDAKTEVTTLASKNANKLAIKNQIAAQMDEFKAAKSDDDKIRIGRQMIKTLNSSEGQDAVGAEEVKRLGSALEYQVANITGPGPMFGRDLEGFESQVDMTMGSLNGAITANQKRMDQLMGRTDGATSEYKPGQVIRLKSGKAYKVQADGHSLEEIKGE